MSRLEDRRREEDDLESYLSRPIPDAPTLPLHERCAQSGFKGHNFSMPGVDPGVCAHCNRTRQEIAALAPKREAA